MAEGTRLLSEYGVYSSIAGSNPALSAQMGIPAEPDHNRRVLAVLAFLRAGR